MRTQIVFSLPRILQRRAEWKTYEGTHGRRTLLQKIQHFMFDARPHDVPCVVTGMGMGGEFRDNYNLNEVIDLLQRKGVNPSKALSAAKQIDLSEQQMAYLFHKVITKVGGFNAQRHAFDTMSTLLEKSKGIFSKDQIIKLAIYLADRNACDVSDNYKDMTAEMENLKKLKEIYSIQQVNYLFDEVIENTKGYADKVFSALADALRLANSRFPPDITVKLIGDIIKKTGKYTLAAFKALPIALDKGLNPEQISELFKSIAISVGDSWDSSELAFNSFIYLFNNLSFRDIQSRDIAISKFTAILADLASDSRNKYLILDLLCRNNDLYKQIGNEYFISHFDLYIDILGSNNRLGFFILKGIIDATRKGIIPFIITKDERDKISSFIKRTYCFKPEVYKLYKDEGEKVLEDLELLSRIVLENYPREGINLTKIASTYPKYSGKEYVYVVIQMAALRFIREAKLDSQQTLELMGEIIGETEKATANAFLSYLVGIEIGLTYNQIIDIFRFVRNESNWREEQVFTALPDVLRIASQIYTPTKILDLLKKLASSTKYNFSANFMHLPVFLEKVRGVFSGEEISTLIGEINSNDTNSLKVISKIFEEIHEFLSSNQMYELCLIILKESGDNASQTLQLLPGVLESLKNKFSSDDIFRLIKEIINQTRAGSENALATLSDILKASDELSSVEQVIDLFRNIRLLLNDSDLGGYGQFAFNALPFALNAKMTLLQFTNLFKHMIKRTGGFDAKRAAAKTFPMALKAVKCVFSPEQIVNLFTHFVDEFAPDEANVFEVLPSIIEKFQGMQFSSDEMFRLLKKMNDAALCFLPPVLDKAKEIFSKHQFIDLIECIFDKKDNIGSRYLILKKLPMALDYMKTMFSPNQIYRLFKRIIKNTEISNCIAVFEELQIILKRIMKTLSSEQTVDFLEKILEKTGASAVSVFSALPIALDIKLTPEQIFDFFCKIVDKYVEHSHDVFRILPEAMTAGLTSEQIFTLFDLKVKYGWDTRQTKKETFKYIQDTIGITEKSFKLIEKLGCSEEIVYLLNNPQTPKEQIEIILKLAREIITNSWSGILNGRPPEELPRIFKFCARVMAEKALFALDKINAMATQTKKPTITVYILSTAYKLKIEKLTDQFNEQGLTREEIREKLRSFYDEVKRKMKDGKTYFEARMEVGKEWLASGGMTRFTQPVFLKIPSGSAPSAKVTQKLEELARLAKDNNYDIIFIDHSTVRTKEVVHHGDPSDFEKGRAIARALDIVDPQQKRRKWLYKSNTWVIPKLDPTQSSMIGLNLYDGQIYESHAGGQKSDWLPVDDHGEFVGVSWDATGEKHRNDYLVITRKGDGKYHVYKASQIFDILLRASVDELRSPEERVKIPVRNILFVCNANHDRSPLAEHLMKRLVARKVEGAEQISISSAGLEVDSWLKTNRQKKEFPLIPSSGTRRLLEQKGIDYQNFTKRQLDHDMINQTQIVFVMTKREKNVLLERFPQAKGKVFVLGEFAEYHEQDWDIPTPKTFNYQTICLFEEALERALRRMSGEAITTVRRIPKKPFRGRPYKKAA